MNTAFQGLSNGVQKDLFYVIDVLHTRAAL